MKQPRRPTRAQKALIRENKLDWNEWMVKDEGNISISLIHKETGKIIVILK